MRWRQGVQGRYGGRSRVEVKRYVFRTRGGAPDADLAAYSLESLVRCGTVRSLLVDWPASDARCRVMFQRGNVDVVHSATEPLDVLAMSVRVVLSATEPLDVLAMGTTL